ncbi:protein argonaute 4A-like [Camellia sinensis]|uniref:protein argonaute 4A-like n=1 Tax=Camellia sinensis TaxID=4442 RepID=UPI001035F95B|nr:protein argonaute 4A-like [Camellia sinensis]XP_028087044.1 protein argonaute 4A-like [Camellia sinensis]
MEISYWTIFSLKVRNADGGYDGGEALQITVYDYFTKHHNIELTYSTFMPCLDVGKPKRPNYHPLETRNATGLVVLATAAGLGASTHTLGTLVPMIGAVAIAIGTVVGSFI